MKFAKCRDCGQWIIWARDGDKRRPFDAQCKFWVVMEDGEDDQGREQSVAVRVTQSHFDTCPKREQRSGGSGGSTQEDE